MTPQSTLAWLLVLTTSLFALTSVPASAQAVADPAQGAVWVLSRLYADSAAWEKERASVESSLPELAQLKGTLGKDAASLRLALDRLSLLRQRLLRMDEYAALKAAEDTSIAENQARVQQVTGLQARFGEATAFVSPEILALGRQRVEAFERQDPGLDRYRRELELILQRRSHA